MTYLTARTLLILLSILLGLWFLAPFLTKRVLNLGNITGMGICLVLFLIGCFLPSFGKFLTHMWQSKCGRVIEILVTIFLTIILILACMAAGLMISGVRRQASSNATVIVLGCKVYGNRPSLMLTERLDAAYDYLIQNPNSACIVSGGKGSDEDYPEADVMKEYLIQKGIEGSRIYAENQSNSTRENLRFSYEIIEKEGLCRNLAIASNEFHLYRAIKVADSLNLRAGSICGRTAWWLLPTYVIREMYGILYELFL